MSQTSGSFEESFDWVVVGSGAGSFASALVMRAAGHSVLILEKTAFAGGTTAKSGGVMWIPANPFMLAEGEDDTLEADIAFHVAVLRASNNPFYAQFRDVVSTALRTSIRFTNRIKGRTASVADHAAVRDAIAAHDPDAARSAMRHLIGDVLTLIDDAEK